METLIITNNPKVNIEFKNKEQVAYYPEADQMEILIKARDYIHLGAKLIMHPMPGRIKPHETPYKSIYIEENCGKIDINSLIIIEDSIAETKKFLDPRIQKKYKDFLLSDLQYIDFLLLSAGVEEYRR